jgi:hypothetical protein
MTAFRVLTVALASLATACSASTFAAGNAAPIASTHIVVFNLTQYRPVSTPYGESGGSKPAVLTVRVGHHRFHGLRHSRTHGKLYRRRYEIPGGIAL